MYSGLALAVERVEYDSAKIISDAGDQKSFILCKYFNRDHDDAQIVAS